jgi:peroxiredoxin
MIGGLMRSERRRFLLSSASLALAPLAACAELKPPFNAVGQRFPDFRLQDIDGNEHASTQYQGRALLANFWATWCPPCRIEMPDLNRVHQRDARHGIQVIGFAIDDNPNPVREFRLRVNVSFPLLLDTGMALANRIGIKSYPTTLLVGADGIVSEVIVGIKPWLEYPGVATLRRKNPNAGGQ